MPLGIRTVWMSDHPEPLTGPGYLRQRRWVHRGEVESEPSVDTYETNKNGLSADLQPDRGNPGLDSRCGVPAKRGDTVTLARRRSGAAGQQVPSTLQDTLQLMVIVGRKMQGSRQLEEAWRRLAICPMKVEVKCRSQ